MNKKVAIHQPEFFPWLGFFYKLQASDYFVILDVAQYNKQDYQNRNTILCSEHAGWITVPLLKHNTGILIEDVLICNTIKWQRKMLEKLFQYYHTDVYYKEIVELFEPVWNEKWEKLVDLNIFIIRQIVSYLQINVDLYLASDLIGNLHDFSHLTASEKNLSICRKLNASQYISGIYGKKYLDSESFAVENIDIEYSSYPINDTNYSILHYLFKNGVQVKNFFENGLIGKAGNSYEKNLLD